MGIVRRLLGIEVSTDVIELLTEQHREVDALIERLEAGGGDGTAVFAELADKLAAHAAAEEEVFYPAVMAKDTESLLHEAVEEHLSLKRLLADMLTLRPGEPAFAAKLSVLKEQVSHHAHKEEEAKLFPKLRAVMSIDERAAIGNEFLIRFEELMAAAPSHLVPSQIKAASPLPAVAKR